MGIFSSIILLIPAVFGPIILWVLHSKLAKILLIGGGDRAAWKQIVDPLQVRCRRHHHVRAQLPLGVELL